VDLGIIRFEALCLAVARHGLIQPAKAAKEIGKIVVNGRVVRLEAQCLAVVRLRLGCPTERGQDYAQVIVGVRKIRPKTQGLSATRLGLRQPAKLAEHSGKVVVGIWKIRVQFDCAADVPNRQLVLPRLVGDDAQQMQRVDMMWRLGEHLTVCRFSLAKVSRFMVGETTLEQVSDVSPGEHWSGRVSFSCGRATLLTVQTTNPRKSRTENQ
jgi:hypothetical protein